MSVHSNTLLIAALTPEGLSRRTMKNILDDNGLKHLDESIAIGDFIFFPTLMESDYDEEYQISAKKGDLVFYANVTCGYGDTIEWEKLEKARNDLLEWVERMCKTHNCSYKILVSANYW